LPPLTNTLSSMRLLPHTCLSAFLLFLISCTGDKRNIRAYYFPVGALKQGRVYEYERRENGVVSTEYWYYQTIRQDSGLFLVSTYYDRNFEVGQIMREKIVRSGALARDYFLYEPDSTTGKAVQIPTVIESGSVFPFQVSDSLGIFLFSLRYHPVSEPAATISVIRNRYFKGDAPDVEFQGKKYPCIRIGIREAIGTETEGRAEVEGTGEEWYAKGLGLVYSTKTFSGGKLKMETRLKDVFPMTELEKRAGSSSRGQ